MDVKIDKTWKAQLGDEFKKDYFKKLTDFVRSQYKTKKIYPLPKNIFRAFDLCPFDKVKVVLIGQDPYHGPKQAHGLAFSVETGTQTPPSLVNIFKEIESDLGEAVNNSNLSSWAEQGVLLLNATLTVVASQAGSHQRQGWEEFTNKVIQILSEKKDGLVFLLWGAYAQGKAELVDSSRHLILQAPHPSPLSAHRGFLGCRHFSKTNKYLAINRKEEINWNK